MKNNKKMKIFGGVVLVTVLFIAFSSLIYYLSNNNSFGEKGASAYTPIGTVYVATNGLDTNNGSSLFPVKTLAKAVTLVKPGYVVRIRPGTYRTNLSITNLKGTQVAPIVFIGDSSDPTQYPVIDGGDSTFANKVDSPAFKVTGSSWISFERLKIINSSKDSIEISNSSYIVVRRNIINYHSFGVMLRDKANHVLVEYNEFFQKFPVGSTWTQLKDSKWEGGAYTSFGGAGMNTIRYNYMHDMFNGIYMNKDVRTYKYADSNTWIYRNKFENIVDDPYEPESFAFNNHFFNNVLINTHRVASFAPDYSGLLGPIYVYGNYQLITKDPTLEAVTKGRLNSALKLEIGSTKYTNGVYVFNNTFDLNQTNTNTYGLDILESTVRNFTHQNNVYTSLKRLYSSTSLTLNNTKLGNNISLRALGYSEPNSLVTNPLLANRLNEDGRLQSTSAARGKGVQMSFTTGFSNSLVVPALSDYGAYQYGATDFRVFPAPKYEIPTGGEMPSFPANTDWIPDQFGGVNPKVTPLWK